MDLVEFVRCSDEARLWPDNKGVLFVIKLSGMLVRQLLLQDGSVYFVRSHSRS